MMIDGIRFAETFCVVALGIDIDGNKLLLALVVGDSEHATLVTGLLVNLRERRPGHHPNAAGRPRRARGPAQGVLDVLDWAVIQCCQLHKIRNVKDPLPKRLRSIVDRNATGAYHVTSTLEAEAGLLAPSTAASSLFEMETSPASIISAPTGGDAVQGTYEKLAPEPDYRTGDFTVQLALAGRNGFQHSLSLDDSTGPGNGVFARGWDGAGVRSQTCKGVPLYGERDVFVLSRVLDLVQVTDSHPSVGDPPRVERPFVRIKRVADGAQDDWRYAAKSSRCQLRRRRARGEFILGSDRWPSPGRSDHARQGSVHREDLKPGRASKGNVK
ncbi:SpvB/TcaC N-terminal domain-containing protein [Rhodococcus koreensis]